jgi:plasmid stability protein
MRTTLDLPDPVLRELKTRAASNGQSLKDLLNELIQRAMCLPALPASPAVAANSIPVLARLQNAPQTVPQDALSNAELADHLLADDLAKLKRIGFVP